MSKMVVAAMSGGVDSSVAAALLKEQGYNVIGITLNVWPNDESKLACAKTCCSITDIDDARQVCYKLEIPHYVLNMRDYFKETVIDYFVAEYMKGRTPNPCIVCNAHVKFDALLRKAMALGADYVATGHYATICKIPESREYCLKRSMDCHKDQTYVLYMLNQSQLSKVLMPCGEYKKSDIREIAKKIGLPNFEKSDSQDLCFIGQEGYAGFIRENCSAFAHDGNVVDRKGHILGKHDGIYNFKIGQHKGLSKYSDEKLYVTGIDADTATVYTGINEDLFSDEMLVENVHFISNEQMSDGCRTKVKIRYGAPDVNCLVEKSGEDRLKVVFDKPQRAVTPGQSAVFYDEDRVLGGGIIV